MNKLIYPTLKLFTYDPIKVLGDDEGEILDKLENLREKLPPEIERELEQAWTKAKKPYELIFPYPELYSLIKEPIDIYQVEGFYYPVFLEDTYSFLFDCSVLSTEEVKVSCFQKLKNKAPTKLGQMGKTWLIAGAVPPDQTNYEAIAKEAYTTLVTALASDQDLPIPEWPQPKQENFLGATVFEIRSIPLTKTIILENQEILILLYPTETIMKKSLADFRRDLRKLFCFRHKIRWAYKQAQDLTQSLKASFPTYQKAKDNSAIASLLKNSASSSSVPTSEQLQTSLSSSSVPTLEQLQTSLSSSSVPTLEQLQTSLQFNLEAFYRYTTNLSYLEDQLSTIETNQLNYRDCLIKISKKASEKELSIEEKFLKDFDEITVARYQEQIKRDYTTLSSGLRIFDNLINTIRGIVEIEQAKRERSIEDAIAIVGFGVGAAGVAATVFTPFVQNAEKAIQGGATINIPEPSSSVKTSSTPKPSPTPNKDAPPDLSTWWLWVIFLLLCFCLGILSSWLGVSCMPSHRTKQSRD